MQVINVVKKDYNLETLDSWEGNFAEIYQALEDQKSQSDFSWLAAIDPYSKTYINSLQSKVLIRDLEVMLEGSKDESLRERIRSLIAFCSGLKVHNFILFLGD